MIPIPGIPWAHHGAGAPGASGGLGTGPTGIIDPPVERMVRRVVEMVLPQKSALIDFNRASISSSVPMVMRTKFLMPLVLKYRTRIPSSFRVL